MAEFVVATPRLNIENYELLLGIASVESGNNRGAVQNGVESKHEDRDLVENIMGELDRLGEGFNSKDAGYFAYEVPTLKGYSGKRDERVQAREIDICDFVSSRRGGVSYSYIPVVRKILSAVDQKRRDRRKR